MAMAAKLDKSRFTDVSDVVKWRLCLGCGACEYACPEKKNKTHQFHRPGNKTGGTSYWRLQRLF